MRLIPIPPGDLSPEQQPLYREMLAGIEKGFRGFKSTNTTAALIGPWNPWLHERKFGKPIWELVQALSDSPTLPQSVRQMAILVTGAKFYAAYELYSHAIGAEQSGLSDEKIATVAAGQRPSDLSAEEIITYDVTSALLNSGVLPGPNYRQAVKAFGKHGAAELIYLVGLYCLVSVTLNGFDLPVPDDDAK